MSFRDLRLAKKQKIGFGLLLLILGTAHFFSIFVLKTMNDKFQDLSTLRLPKAIAISNINTFTSDLRIYQLRSALAVDAADRDKQFTQMLAIIDEINVNVDFYDSLKTDPSAFEHVSAEEAALYEGFEVKWDQYQDISFEFLDHLENNENVAAIQLINGDAQELFIAFGEDLKSLIELNQAEAAESSIRAEHAFRTTRFITTALLIGAIVMAIVLTGIFVRYITVPVQKLEEAAQAVAAGNLDVHLDAVSKDEIGKLSASFNQMTTSLREATDRLHKQAAALQQQNDEMAAARVQLEEKSSMLEQQKSEILQKNVELFATMEELKSAQEQLLFKEKMASLGDLVAGVAHELNNPIGALTASADVSRRCLDKIESHLGSTSENGIVSSTAGIGKVLDLLRNNIQITTEAGERVAAIVKSLRGFARLDQAEYQRVDIREGIEHSLNLLGAETQQRITIVKQFDDVPAIECYASELNQVFINLLKNAAQAIDGEGEIVIRTFTENGSLCISVQDSGRGISIDRQKTLFDFTFSNSGERVKLGSGLVTAYNIVEKHEGRITVESAPDQGSTFLVALPVR